MVVSGRKSETIYEACRNGNEARVDEYVKNGGCVTEQDRNKMTMLHHAVFSGNLHIVEIILSSSLLHQRIDLDAIDSGGWTPLHYAAERGFFAIAERLVQEGANVNAKDEMKRTPLHLAAAAGRIDVAHLLVKNGAAVGARNVAGMTPMECAEANGQTELLSSLKV
ncbi:putative Ankyrin repeats (3 copies) putative Ankyrin repeat [Trypanosoma vivax]|uniref:Putative ankyrin repeat protein n=1 Tax=Trypanosoma vivax (strain Y486) TaxID=1055687 RepID=G0U3G7_TRYVY|nr:putative ankyrin repeat protein [Trypanosoma vivax]KAH8614221.1 putative Ankyrin repeats (3 copies) putative Ankyrin repeat [Trypanosoma vivax]CCC50824.1 putative ankyrin repeat protein [Trypanosoma vivax Y486]